MSRHLLWSTENFLNEDCTFWSSSEHSLYVHENLYNERPSKPFRTEDDDIGEAGNPAWVCVDLGTYSGVGWNPTLACLFNHNLTQLEAAGDELSLLGCDDGCPGESGACVWFSGFPGCTVDLTVSPCTGLSQPIENFKSLFRKFNCSPGHRYWLLNIIDQNNTDGYIEIGEWWLGEWNRFHTGSPDPNWVHLQPGREDGPIFYRGDNETHYGQDWPAYFSETEQLILTFKNVNNPCYVDEMHVFLRSVMANGGRFVLIPDERMPFCYYVIIKNNKYAQRLVYGAEGELREWRFELKTLTQGAILLG